METKESSDPLFVEPSEQEGPADAPEAEVETESSEPQPEKDEASEEDSLPDWAREKLNKANREARNLRQRLKEQEPLVKEAQEAKSKMSEFDRLKSDFKSLKDMLDQRDTQLLAERYNISDEYVEFIGEGTFEEKEARAAKIGQAVQKDSQERPPTDRPVESLKPGASPSPPPVEDHSYPASWAPPKRD